MHSFKGMEEELAPQQHPLHSTPLTLHSREGNYMKPSPPQWSKGNYMKPSAPPRSKGTYKATFLPSALPWSKGNYVKPSFHTNITEQ
jgi:hypothetical protein